MTIRQASFADVPELLRLLGQVLDIHAKGRPDIFRSGATKYTEQELKKLLNQADSPIFVAENATRVLGYCFCVIKQTEGDYILHDIKTLYIDDLCVDEEARCGGVGRALYEHAKAFAKSIGCYNVTLNVWECNSAARAFYDRMGLKPQKTILEDVL